eukprot:127322_1
MASASLTILWFSIWYFATLEISYCDIFIENALVVIVGVGKYDSDFPDISVPVKADLDAMYNLWSEYGHTVMDTQHYYGSSYLSKHEFEQFMNLPVKSLLIDNSTNYDAFIFFSSSHGNRHSIVFSDQNLDDAFEDVEVFMYKYFVNEQLKNYANIPKLFFINKCRNIRQINKHSEYSFGSNAEMRTQNQANRRIAGDNFRFWYPTYPGDTAYGDASGSFLFQSVDAVINEQYDMLTEEHLDKSQSLHAIQKKMKRVLRGYDQTLHDGGSLETDDVYFKLNVHVQKFTNFILLLIANCTKQLESITFPVQAMNSSIFSIIKTSKISFNEFKTKKKAQHQTFLEDIIHTM